MQSVLEIQKECHRMLTLCENLYRVDIHYASKRLTKSLKQLVSEFNKDLMYTDNIIAELKDTVCSDAINLECILSKFNEGLHKRYEDRIYVRKVYLLVKSLLNKRINKNKIVNLLCDYYEICKIYQDSTALLFCLDGVDKEMVELIYSECLLYDKGDFDENINESTK